MRRLYVRPGETIKLGREGENEARQWVFDFSRWVDTFGMGAVQLIVQRPGECQPYPVPLEIEGENAVWTVTNIDTSVVGTGKAEYQYYVGETLEKSAVFTTSIVDALGEPSDTPPDAYEHYMEAMLEVASRAEVAKQEAEKAVDKAEEIKNEVEKAISFTITAIRVEENANGDVTITNTLEGGTTETIAIIADTNGNPASVNSVPITWTEASA